MNEFGHSGELASVIMRLDLSHKPAQPHPNVLNAIFSLDAPPPWTNQLPELQEHSLVFINFPVHETLLQLRKSDYNKNCQRTYFTGKEHSTLNLHYFTLVYLYAKCTNKDIGEQTIKYRLLYSTRSPCSPACPLESGLVFHIPPHCSQWTRLLHCNTGTAKRSKFIIRLLMLILKYSNKVKEIVYKQIISQIFVKSGLILPLILFLASF